MITALPVDPVEDRFTPPVKLRQPITTLRIKDTKIAETDTEFKEFLANLSSYPSLTNLEVEITEATACNDTVQQLAQTIAKLSSLTALTVIDQTSAEILLPHDMMDFSGTKDSLHILEMALTSKTIETLVIERIFSLSGLIQFNKALLANNTLKCLRLVNQLVMGEGARQLFFALFEHRSIKQIEFNRCTFGERGNVHCGRPYVKALSRKFSVVVEEPRLA
jgi:hypothetical protein